MSFPNPSRHTPDERTRAEKAHQNWMDRRRDKIAGEIARNRRGEYTVPTWVLALILVLIVGAWAALVVLS